MRCDAPLQRVWAECRSPMRIFTLLIAQANDGLHTHTTHISHFSVFFFLVRLWICLSCSTHKSTSRIHRNNPTTTRPVFALPQHAASHLSFVVHNLRQASTEKKKLSELRIDICDQSRWTDEKYITDEKGIYSSRHWNRVCSTHLALFPTTSSHTQFPTTHTQRTWK